MLEKEKGLRVEFVAHRGRCGLTVSSPLSPAVVWARRVLSVFAFRLVLRLLGFLITDAFSAFVSSAGRLVGSLPFFR